MRRALCVALALGAAAACDFTGAMGDYCNRTGRCPDGGRGPADGGADSGIKGGPDGGGVGADAGSDGGGVAFDAGTGGGAPSDGGDDGGCPGGAMVCGCSGPCVECCGNGDCPGGDVCASSVCCTPESDVELCARVSATGCAPAAETDRCGQVRTVTCNPCGCAEACDAGANACEPMNLGLGDVCEAACPNQCAQASFSLGTCASADAGAPPQVVNTCCQNTGIAIGSCASGCCPMCCSNCAAAGVCAGASACDAGCQGP